MVRLTASFLVRAVSAVVHVVADKGVAYAALVVADELTVAERCHRVTECVVVLVTGVATIVLSVADNIHTYTTAVLTLIPAPTTARHCHSCIGRSSCKLVSNRIK